MNKVITSAVAIMALLIPVACPSEQAPSSGGGGGGGGNANFGDGTAGKLQGRYVIRLDALDKNAGRARRTVECTVTAFRGRDVVTVVDPQTGRTTPYVTHVRDLRTPGKLNINDYAKVETIVVRCTMRGEPGDSLHLEVTDVTGSRMAPQRATQDLDIIPDGGIRATVFTTIVANA